MNLRHVILTRFNLATPGREATFRNRPDWLEGRFELFERYCLPCLAAQDCQDFDWIVYFDEATPARIRERIEAGRRVRDFTPYYTPLFPSEGWRNSVLELIGDDRRDALLTTNLDNDDGLAVDFVSRVQRAGRAAPAGVACALNLTNGYVLCGPGLYAHAHPSNAFTNLLEPYSSSIRTAADVPHMELARHVPVIQVPGPGAWLQVVHGGNVSNKVRGRRVSRSAAEQRLPAVTIEQVRDPGAAERMLETLVAAPSRSARDLAIRLAKSALNGVRRG